jgi:hypothetical protein
MNNLAMRAEIVLGGDEGRVIALSSEMSSKSRGVRRISAAAVVAAVAALLTTSTRGANPRFYPDDPLDVDRDTLSTRQASNRSISAKATTFSKIRSAPGQSRWDPCRQREHARRGAGFELVHESHRTPADVRGGNRSWP